MYMMLERLDMCNYLCDMLEADRGCDVDGKDPKCTKKVHKYLPVLTGKAFSLQEGQHPMTGQRAANFRRDLGAM